MVASSCLPGDCWGQELLLNREGHQGKKKGNQGIKGRAARACASFFFLRCLDALLFLTSMPFPLLSDSRRGIRAWIRAHDELLVVAHAVAVRVVLANLDFTRIHPLNGPVFVDGAEPGHVLEVEVLQLKHKGWGSNGTSTRSLSRRKHEPPSSVQWARNGWSNSSASSPNVTVCSAGSRTLATPNVLDQHGDLPR